MYYEFVTTDESTDERDGMMVEMYDIERGFLAEVFEDDVTGERFLTLFAPKIPLPAIERLLAETRARLGDNRVKNADDKNL